MKRLLVTTTASLLLLTACGAAEDSTAATVGTRDITVAKVDRLAASPYISAEAAASGEGRVSSPNGTTGTTLQRFALRYYVMTAVLEEIVEDRGSSILDVDRQTAEQQIGEQEAAQQQQGGGGLDSVGREALVGYYAAQAAVRRVVTATPEQVQDYFDEHRDELGDIICIEGFGVATEAEGAAAAALAGGAEVADILGDPSLLAQPLSENGGELCLFDDEINNPTLEPLVLDGALGTWGSTVLSSPQAGDISVFIRPNSRGPGTLDDEAVQAKVQTLLGNEVDEQLRGAISDVEVDLDPRYGIWDPEADVLILAPPSPRPSAAAGLVEGLAGA